MPKRHSYSVTVEWTGNQGPGTIGYKAYKRDHTIGAEGKTAIEGSSDPSFRGDPERWNPEELLVAALSACHKLWYLHLCAVNGVAVLGYTDRAEGTMVEDEETAGGRFVDVCLRPRVVISAESAPDTARALQEAAHRACFIANSINFPVSLRPEIVVARSGPAAANERLEP